MNIFGKIAIWLTLLFLLFGHSQLSDAPKRDWKGIVDSVRKDQINFCLEKTYNDIAEKRIVRSTLAIDGRDRPIYVFGDESGVSECVRRGDGWETHEITVLSDFLANYMKKHNIGNPRTISFLDIGMNVGVYSISLGSKGYRVFGFDPSWYNIYAMRRSLCENPTIDALVFGYGLSNNDTECEAYALKYFTSNYVVCCGGLMKEFQQQNVSTGDWRLVQTVELRMLDNFAEHIKNVVAIKLDVEGYEPYVIDGGMKVLLGKNVSIIMIEYNELAMRRTGRDPHSIIKPFVDSGFAVRFADKPWDDIDMKQVFVRLDNECSGESTSCNLFLIKAAELDNFKVSKPLSRFVVLLAIIVVLLFVCGIVRFITTRTDHKSHQEKHMEIMTESKEKDSTACCE